MSRQPRGHEFINLMDHLPFFLDFERPPDPHLGHLAVVCYGVHHKSMRNLNNNKMENLNYLKLNKEFKLTFIFSTHDQRLIDQVRTVLYIKDGQISESRVHNV